MTPTTDDLRALLERRADAAAGAFADAAAPARLAGVRDRIRQRRRARAAAAGLTLAVLAGGVTAGTAALRRSAPPSPAPAVLPQVDTANRPLLATLRAQGGGAQEDDARLEGGWTDLHLALSCTGSNDVTAVVLVSGRAVARVTCTGSGSGRAASPPEDVVVTPAQARAWGLRPDEPVTVGLHLTRTPAGGRALAVDEDVALPDAHAVLDLYGRGTLPTLPEVPPTPMPSTQPPGPRVLLGTVTLPVTKEFATPSITVVTGGPLVDVELACAAPAGSPPFVLEVDIHGVYAARECGPGVWRDAGTDSAAARDVGAGGGRPIRITLRLTPFDKGFERGKGPSLGRDIPGALVGITVRGTPYLGPVTAPAPH